jgi:hypothetical protein
MDIKLTTSGDIDLGDNYTMTLCDTEEQLVRQRIMIVFGVNRSEWDYDLDFGVPWLETELNKISILGKVPKAVFDGYIKQAILTREGVESILEYQSTPDPKTRVITTTVKVLSTSGEIITITNTQ